MDAAKEKIPMNEGKLREYARLIVRVGAAVKKGQPVIIRTDVNNEAFTAIVVEECYKAGASRIVYEWKSGPLRALDYRYGDTKVLGHPSPTSYALSKFQAEELPAFIWLDNDDPDSLKGVDAAKVAEIRRLNYAEMAEFIEKAENRYQWTIAGCYGKKWAAKMFPALSEEDAKEALWEAILKTSRADSGDPVKNWDEHERDLKSRCDKLNSLHLCKLHYTASNGTDLTVGLIPGVLFMGGGETDLQGDFFQPNIPSEECFTSPMRGKAEGIVYASKPLAYNGQLIDRFSVRFEKGKAVEVQAEKGEAALKSILTLDEGSAYLGECALVPFDSPINRTGLLFFNTLYDENACCHLALGRGFTDLYPHFEKYTEDELHAFGINKSLSHVDFMIGTADLSIVGTDEEDREIALFKNGTWAF
jgi:aminopeptidase